MEIPLLQDIVIIFSLSVFVIWAFQKIKIPPIIGFLITGILIGPDGVVSDIFSLKIIENSSHEIDYLAEIGVILLLFTIGIEFSIKNLLKIKRTVLLGGSLQVLLAVTFSYLVASSFGYGFGESIFMGFLVALSSTAIVLRIYQKMGDVSSLHGKTSLGILIFQDIIIVPMILFTPILAGKSANIPFAIVIMVVKAAGLIAFTIISSRWLVPKILHQIVKTGSHELFLLTILVVGFSVAWLTSALGLSLALGAFLAGLAISESEYSHQAFGNIIPFRDIFTAFFFVSVGMLVDVSFIISNIFTVIIFTFAVISIKTFVSGLVTFILGFPFRTTVIVGLSLSQIGEFSFILAKIGIDNGFLIKVFSDVSINNYYYQLFLAVTTVTMALTPLIIASSPSLSRNIIKLLPLPKKFINGLNAFQNVAVNSMNNHLVIIGMGRNGSNIAQAAKTTGIDYIAVDADPELVREKAAEGEPVFFGNAEYEPVLQHVIIEKAKAVVISVNNPASTFTIVKLVRKLNPGIYSIVRTEFIEDVEDLYKFGANIVIPREYETSIEIFSKVLAKYLIPRDQIEKLINEFRSYSYEIFRNLEHVSASLCDFIKFIPDLEVVSIRISNKAKVKDMSLGEINLRKIYGVTMLAIKRGDDIIDNPGQSVELLVDDLVFLMGKKEQINKLYKAFI
jgi:CPA2 family monovalent cation:H+ antiporter-2